MPFKGYINIKRLLETTPRREFVREIISR